MHVRVDVGLLVRWCIDSLVLWFGGSLVGRSVWALHRWCHAGSVFERIVGSLVHWFACPLIRLFVASLASWLLRYFIGAMMGWFVV